MLFQRNARRLSRSFEKKKIFRDMGLYNILIAENSTNGTISN